MSFASKRINNSQSSYFAINCASLDEALAPTTLLTLKSVAAVIKVKRNHLCLFARVLCSAHHPRRAGELLHGRHAQPALLPRPELQHGAASLLVLSSRQVGENERGPRVQRRLQACPS